MNSERLPDLCCNPFFRLHHRFAAYEGPKHFAVSVDPSATPQQQMLKLNLDSATSNPRMQGRGRDGTSVSAMA